MESLPQSTLVSGAWIEQFAASLHAERDGASEFLATQQQRLERAEAVIEELIDHFDEAVERAVGGTADPSGDLEYQRRYEMALDDVRELKASNAQLQDQLAKARAAASTQPKQPPSHNTKLDWEAEKLRILAALESDQEENDSECRAERLKIEDVLRSTEKALADKDNELRELRRKLEESSRVNSLMQAATAVEQVLQSDTAIQQERERLKQLEEQMQNRLCQAEIEISLERAKLARERAELEDRLRTAGLDTAQTSNAPTAPAAPQQPARGRWLSRLGLTDADREHGRRR